MTDTIRIHRLPASTGNRMDINDIPGTLPALSGAELTLDTDRAAGASAALAVETGAGKSADAVFA